MSPIRPSQAERTPADRPQSSDHSNDARSESRSSRVAAHAPHSRAHSREPLSAPLPDLDGHGFSRGTPASRKAVRLSLILLSVVAVCAFGFGLLTELVG